MTGIASIKAPNMYIVKKAWVFKHICLKRRDGNISHKNVKLDASSLLGFIFFTVDLIKNSNSTEMQNYLNFAKIPKFNSIFESIVL